MVLCLFNITETNVLRESSTSEFSHSLDPTATSQCVAASTDRPHGTISFIAQARRVLCIARPWPSWPRSSALGKGCDCRDEFCQSPFDHARPQLQPIALLTLPHSGDRTGLRQSSPQKREFLRCEPETFGIFSSKLSILGAWRLSRYTRIP